MTKIIVSAILNEEQVTILAKQKWYQDTVLLEWEYIPNPKSKEDFIRQVYESIILSDATREYITYSTRQKEEARIVEENVIRDEVAQSITSSIE